MVIFFPWDSLYNIDLPTHIARCHYMQNTVNLTPQIDLEMNIIFMNLILPLKMIHKTLKLPASLALTFT